MRNRMFKACSKLSGMADKAKRGITAAVSAVFMSCIYVQNAFATGFQIDTEYQVSDNLENVDPEGMIIGLAFWMARLVGIGMLIWGVYGYLSARKDGEAESMNGALGKLISGIALVAMPSILRALGVLG